MGWTFQEFISQPDWLIDTLDTMEDIDAQVSKSEKEDLERKAGGSS